MDSVIDSILQDLVVLGKVRAKCKRFSEKFGVRQFYTQVFLEADGSAVYKACFEAPVGHPLLCPVDGCMTVDKCLTLYIELQVVVGNRALWMDYTKSVSGLFWLMTWKKRDDFILFVNNA